MFLFFLSCTKNPILPTEQPSIPILPAPQAQWYSTEGDPPKDPLVMKVSQKLNWSESLSGAAADIGLKIKGRAPRIEDAKWAAIRAGFPYQVYRMVVGDVDLDTYPKDLERLLRALNPERLGLVRVRVGTKDRWIALLGSSGALEEGFPREAALGQEIEIKGAGSLRVMAPSGEMKEATLPYTFQPHEAGEWWIEVEKGNIYSSLPLYVDVGTPVTNLFTLEEDLGLINKSPSEVEAEVLMLMDLMREKEGLATLNADKMLDSLAQYPLQYFLEDRWDPKTGVEHLQKAGFVGGPVYQLACEAENSLACLDQLSWNMNFRFALLDPQIRNIGIKAHVETSSVSLLLNLSSQ